MQYRKVLVQGQYRCNICNSYQYQQIAKTLICIIDICLYTTHDSHHLGCTNSVTTIRSIATLESK